ncbi:MAG: S9 family peptidase [Bacteroidetes bacterium]|nr:MAG: S9 family peptidase [Bacteroidota bacterium]
MKRRVLAALALLLVTGFTYAQELVYPKSNKGNQVDDYFGTQVADPYRWMENDTAIETANWVKEENLVTQKYLESIPYRGKINKRLASIWNYPKYSAPFHEGEYYYFYKNDGIQNQYVLYRQKGLYGAPKVFLDPNKLSDDGTVALTNFSISNDSKYAVYGISRGGSDWNEFYVLDVATGDKMMDHIKWVKFSGASWKGDGFYYSRYDEPAKGAELSSKNEFHKVYYHKLGTPQSEDILTFSNPDQPLRNYYAMVTRDERFLIIYESESTSGSGVYYQDLSLDSSEIKQIINGFDHEHSVIDNYEHKLLMMTNNGAPKFRLVLIDPLNPADSNWTVVIPEKEEPLKGVNLAGGTLVVRYLKDASSRAYVHTLDGKLLHELALPNIGTMSGLKSKKEDTLAFYSYSTFTSPPVVYKYKTKKNISIKVRNPETKFDLSSYVTKQIFYKSKDGTPIPMFLVHKRNIVMDGSNPTLLYGYGGFDISITPRFSLSNVIFMESGGIYAVANIRGGGEYGEEWHKAGTKLNKQNVFDDFIAAAEYLIENKYTSSEKLAISGRSNGGLLVGACMTQRPDLYKVALPAVGVMDMLRFHKFTIGWAWTGDYGSSENEEEFKYLYGYSPVHNIKPGVAYPATLVTTADHDDRVVPAHSFKFIATLQEHHVGPNPVLARIETMAGHGAGKPTSKRIEEGADILSFLFYNLGMKMGN